MFKHSFPVSLYVLMTSLDEYQSWQYIVQGQILEIILIHIIKYNNYSL